MSNYANTKATIAANVYENHLNQVTANMAKAAINSVVDALIAGGYLYAGVAHIADAASTPDANVFKIATEVGTYTNYKNSSNVSLVVNDGEVAVFKYNGSWSKEVTGAATAAQVTELGHEVDGKLLNNFFIGNNNTYSSHDIYGLVPGQVYRVYLWSTSWDVTGVTSTGVYFFSVNSVHNGTQTKLAGSTTMAGLSPYYDITIPLDSDFVRIGGRATTGVEVDYIIVPLADKAPQLSYVTQQGFSNLAMIEEGTFFGSNSIFVRFPAGSSQIGVDNTYTNFTRTEISTSLGVSLVTSPGGLSGCLEIAHKKTLVYNYGNAHFYLRGPNEFVPKDILIISCYYGTVCLIADAINSRVIYNSKELANALYQFNTRHFFDFRNGTPGNQGNANMITSAFIPTNGARSITISTKRPNAAGCRYVYGIAVTKSIYDLGEKGVFGDNMVGPHANTTMSVTAFSNKITIPDGYLGVAVVIGESDGSDYSPVRVSDFVGYGVDIVLEGGQTMSTYQGAPIKLNSFGYRNLLNITSLGWHQSMAIYGEYGIFFNERDNIAKLVNVYSGTILGSFTIPYGTYSAPHCNTASIGPEKYGADSVMPLIYVSQWTAGAERACFVYDVKLVGGVYSMDLVQKINLSGVSSTLIGEGPCDFVVDTNNNQLVAYAYKTAQSVNNGTAMMVCKIALPSISDSEVLVVDADIIDHYEAENIVIRQDAFYNGGKLYCISGYGNSERDSFVTVVRLSDGFTLTKLRLNDVISGEPEGFDILGDKIVFTKGDVTIYELVV